MLKTNEYHVDCLKNNIISFAPFTEPPPITYSYASNYRSEYGWPKFSEDWMKPNQCTNRHDVDRFYKVAKGGGISLLAY